MKATYDLREFQAALKRASHALSTDDERPVLECAHVVGTPQGTKIHAADGFRAVFAKCSPSYEGEKFEILIDPAGVKSILAYKLRAKDEPDMVLDFDDCRWQITIAGKKVPGEFAVQEGSLGRYPEVNQIKPTRSTTSFACYPAPLLRAVKSARVFAREGSNVVRLHITESLLVEGISEETGSSMTEVTTYRRTGPELLIAFNADFLIDCLKTADPSEYIKFEFNKHTMPVLITYHNGDEEVIMPMHLENRETIKRAEELPEREFTGESYVWPGSPETPNSFDWLEDEYNGKHHGLTQPEKSRGYISDDIFHSVPEPGAVEYDLTGATFDVATETHNWKDTRVPRITLELTNPRPIPDAPAPLVVWQPPVSTDEFLTKCLESAAPAESEPQPEAEPEPETPEEEPIPVVLPPVPQPIPVEIPVPVYRPSRYASFE